MNYEDAEFLAEIYSKINEIEEFIEKSGYSDRVLSAFVFGFMEQIEDEDQELVEMKSLFSYNLESIEELETIKTIMEQTFEDPDDHLRGLLSDLGISLN
jgi:hypothetical protein